MNKTQEVHDFLLENHGKLDTYTFILSVMTKN